MKLQMIISTPGYGEVLIATKEKSSYYVSHSSSKTGGWEAISETIYPATLRITEVCWQCCIESSSTFSAVRSIIQ